MVDYYALNKAHTEALTEAGRVLADTISALYDAEDKVSQMRVAIAIHRRSVEKMRDAEDQKPKTSVRLCDRELWAVLGD